MREHLMFDIGSVNRISSRAGNMSRINVIGPDLLFAGLVIIFVLLSFSSSRHESVTIDEFRHLSTGVYYWQSGDLSFDDATPPLWKMAMSLPAHLAGAERVRFRQLPEGTDGWEPWLVATDFMRDNASAYTGYLQSARMVNILAATICIVFLYLRCRKFFGPAAALFGTAFLAFSPTFLAHSHYATTDIIATLTMMGVVFLLLDYLKLPTPGRLAGAVWLFSLSLLCKFTALLVAPLLLLVPFLVAVERAGRPAGIRKDISASFFYWLNSMLLISVIILLTVNLFYGFKGTGTTFGQMHLKSRALTALGQSAAGAIPVPLPRAFVEGFDRQKADSDYSEFPAFLMNRWSADGFRIYYLAAFGMKESLPFLILLAAAMFSLVWQRGQPFRAKEMLLLCYLPLIIFLVLSCLNRLNIGVRYLLPAYPFFCILIARLYRSGGELRGTCLMLPLLFVLHSVSVFRIAPHYTSYFNELSGGAASGYHYLIDSNIDWGQDLLSLKKYMSEHHIEKVQLAYFGHGLPEFYGINYEPLASAPHSGYVAISVTLLQGNPYLLTYIEPPQLVDLGHFGFMRNLQPVGRAGYSILIYQIR